MEKKLLLLQGPPSSGKSTWAKKFKEEHPDVVIVSRDAIRHSFGEYNMEHEAEVTVEEERQTIEAMEKGLFVINDGTNLNKKYLPKWHELAEKYGYEIGYKLFYVPFKVAVERDKNEDREHHVGKSVIKRFYLTYFKEQYEEEEKQTVYFDRVPIDKSLPPCVICDIDSTVSWMQHRSPYNIKESVNDLPDERMVQLLERLMSDDVTVVFVTGREDTEENREVTLKWLRGHLSGYTVHKLWTTYEKFSLLMRPRKNGDKDCDVKKYLYETYIKDKYDVICVFEDRDRNVDMWREQGLLCLQPNRGNY